MDEIPPEVPGYRLTRRLGAGSTATVWRARREDDDELVAVKLLAGTADEQAVREYSLLQSAAGEHVVTLHETVTLDGPDGPATALVLEHLAGGSLGRVVAERGHLSPGETVTIIAPVAEALADVHDGGLVHGDLSPGNVLLDSTGRPVLADLGYSRLTGEPPGEVHGTEGHVAPEVLEGAEPGRASDVYALGSLAWLCLVGAPPDHVAVRADLGELLPEHPALVEAVEACLAGDPEARPEADEVARAVFDATPAEPVRLVTPGDVATSLTRRIREAAQEGSPVPQWQRELTTVEPSPPTRPRWRRRRSAESQRSTDAPRRRTKGGRHAAPRREAEEPIDLTVDPSETPPDASPARSIARTAGARSARGRAVGALVAGVLTVLLAVLVPWQQLANAGDVAEPVASPTVDDGVLTRRAAPREAPIQLARELTALRERLVGDLDRRAVTRLDEPGSPAAERDGELLDALQAGGERYRGFRMTVRSARLERTTGTSVVLRTVVDESAYEVVGSSGQATSRPARRGQQVDLVIAWDGSRWRVRDVLAAAS